MRKKISKIELRKVVRRITLIILNIDNDIDMKEIKKLKKILSISSIKNLDSEGIVKLVIEEKEEKEDEYQVFLMELEKVKDPNQQELVSKIIIDVVNADGTIDENEKDLLRILVKTYHKVDFRSIFEKEIKFEELIEKLRD